MGKLSKEVLRIVSDDAVVHNALVLRQAIETIEEEGIIPEDHGLFKELRHNLRVMKGEIKRRGLEVPEKKEQGKGVDTSQGRKGAAAEA